MTRKDFEIIAQTINGLLEDYPTKRRIAISFAARLAAVNARFNAQKFYKACGVEA